MNRSLLGAMVVLATSTVMGQDASELFVEQRPFRVYSAFWPTFTTCYTQKLGRAARRQEKEREPCRSR